MSRSLFQGYTFSDFRSYYETYIDGKYLGRGSGNSQISFKDWQALHIYRKNDSVSGNSGKDGN
jgi:hypothetical protein